MISRQFKTDFYVLPTGECIIVLGVQWMETLDGLCFNFKQHKFQVMIQGRARELKGTHNNKLLANDVQMVEGTICQIGEGLFCHLQHFLPDATQKTPIPHSCRDIGTAG